MQKNLPYKFSVTESVDYQAAPQHVELNGAWLSCPQGVFQSLEPERSFEERPRIQVEESLKNDFVSLLVSGRLDITANNLEPVTFAAYKNKLGLLLRICEDLYLSQLSTLTCLKLWIVGIDHGCQRLTKRALRLVQDSFEDIADKDEFCDIDKYKVMDLIEDPFINVTSLHTVYNAILRWSNYDSGSRRRERDEIMQHFHRTTSENCLFYHSLQEQCDNNNNKSRIRRVSSTDSEPDSFLESSNSSNMCYRGVCCQSSSRELSVFEATVKNGNLLVELFDNNRPWPKGLDRDTTFSYSKDNGCIYGTQDNKVWYYAPGATSWKELAKLPIERTHQSACSSNGRLFALGGYDYHSSIPSHRVFTYKKGKWVRDIKGHKVELTQGVHSCQCVTVGSLLYIFGLSFSNTADGKKTKTQSLQRIDTSHPGRAELLPTPAFAKDGVIARCVVPSPNGLLYVISSQCHVLEYDPINNSYTILPGMPMPRYSFGAFVHEGSLYVFGGETKDTSANSATQCYSLNLSYINPDWHPCGFLSKTIKIL